MILSTYAPSTTDLRHHQWRYVSSDSHNKTQYHNSALADTCRIAIAIFKCFWTNYNIKWNHSKHVTFVDCTPLRRQQHKSIGPVVVFACTCYTFRYVMFQDEIFSRGNTLVNRKPGHVRWWWLVCCSARQHLYPRFKCMVWNYAVCYFMQDRRTNKRIQKRTDEHRN